MRDKTTCQTRSRPIFLSPGTEIHRHYHAHPYATLVLEGGYEEAGDAGRWRVEPGDVLLHSPFSAHRDWISRTRTLVLDLPLPMDGRKWPGRVRTANPDMLARIAERCAIEATSLLLEAFEPGGTGQTDTPDNLAATLTRNADHSITGWAKTQGCARETASRRFSMVYGVAPARYRGEARARRAWRMLVEIDDPLAVIAADAGYADQPHMTRAVKALTGHSPGHWRRWRETRSHSFKT